MAIVTRKAGRGFPHKSVVVNPVAECLPKKIESTLYPVLRSPPPLPNRTRRMMALAMTNP